MQNHKVLFAAFSSLILLFTSPALAEGDAEKGAKVFKKCKACHAVGEGAKHKIGPHLNQVFGRTAGQVEGFRKYSKAMKKAGQNGLVWNEETLAQFIHKPKKTVKRTKMAFAGLKKDEDIVNVLAYLMQFSGEASAATPAGDDAAADEGPAVFDEAFMTNPEHIALGGELWKKQCRHCHGASAYPGKAPKLKPKRYKPEFAYKRITKGFRKMPAWEDVYSKHERMAIVAYIKSNAFSP